MDTGLRGSLHQFGGASAVYSLDRRIPADTKLTIIELGLNDRNFLGASPPDIASSLAEIIRRVRAKGSVIILVRSWWQRDDAAFAAVQQSADAVVSWWFDLWFPGRGLVRPEYNSGDHSHLNAAGTDVVVSHALPDMERVLTQMGFDRTADRAFCYNQIDLPGNGRISDCLWYKAVVQTGLSATKKTLRKLRSSRPGQRIR